MYASNGNWLQQEEQHQLTDHFEVYGNSTHLSQRALYPRSLV